MKTREDFINEYERTFHAIISKSREDKLKEFKKMQVKCYAELTILMIAVIVILFLVYKNNLSIFVKFAVFFLSAFLISGLYIVNLRIMNNEKKRICYILNVSLYSIIARYLSNNTFYFGLDTQISEEDFNKMKLFNTKYLKFTGSDITAAEYKEKKLVMCDVWLYDLVDRIKSDTYYSSNNIKYTINYHYKDRVDIFKGLYYETTINRDNKDYIYMIPNNLNDKFIQKNIYHYINYHGEKIELENLDFSERYSVFSLDEVGSRYILSLSLMEKINALDNLIKNKKYFVFKPDDRVGIFISGFQIDKLLNETFAIDKDISNEYLIKFFETVKKLFDISDLLEDINTYK